MLALDETAEVKEVDVINKSTKLSNTKITVFMGKETFQIYSFDNLGSPVKIRG
jgi:hypothetical protein